MRRIRSAWPACLVIILSVPAGALKLTIVHTNDIHGWIMARPAKDGSQRLEGGAAALASLFKRQPNPKLLVDAGDWFQGTPEGSVSRGQAAISVFNAIPYDCVVIGNHEFDLKEARLKELVARLRMPALAANVYDAKTRQRVPYLKPWVVKQVAGVKIGIFGLLTTNMRNLSFPDSIEGLEFRGEVASARHAVAALKQLGATVIILISHVGFEQSGDAPFTGDQTIAREVPGIDLIVGGHTHTFLRKPYRDPVHGTLIVQAGAYLAAAGVVALDIDDKTGTVVSKDSRLVNLDAATVGSDPKLAALVAAEAKKVSEVYDVVIATAEAMLSRSRESESAIGDWMTDCERQWSGADLAVQNGGGIRADMPKGPVTLRDIFNIMPFDNYVTKLEMDGSLVRDMLDHGVDNAKGIIQESGATFAYRRDAERGQRLRDVAVGGRPLDPQARYKVVTIDFLVKGGDGYTPFSRAEKTERTPLLLRDLLADCARQQRSVTLPQGSRMRAIQEAER